MLYADKLDTSLRLLLAVLATEVILSVVVLYTKVVRRLAGLEVKVGLLLVVPITTAHIAPTEVDTVPAIATSIAVSRTTGTVLTI